MASVVSKFKIFPFVITGALNIPCIYLIFGCLSIADIDLLFSDDWINGEVIMLAALCTLIFCIIPFYFLLQLKIINVNKDRIIFRTLIFPFIKREMLFSEYDYLYTNTEIIKGRIDYTIWLIKNKKLRDRISSFYYANYDEIIAAIHVKNKGELNIGYIKENLAHFGWKIE